MSGSLRKAHIAFIRLKRRVFDSLIVRLIVVVVFLILVGTLVLHHAEKATDPDAYGTYARTIRTMMVLFLSGFDVAHPRTAAGWVCALLMLCSGLSVVAVVTAHVASVLVATRIGGNNMANIKLVNHILLCGWSSVGREIVEQLLSEDIQNVRHIVVIDEKVEGTPYHDPYVFFVCGDPPSAAALSKANAKEAATAIVLADRSLTDANLRDSKTTLITLAVRSVNPTIHTCVELMRSENIHHLRRVNADEIICVSELSRGLIAQAAVSHGLSRFFADILAFNTGSEVYKHQLPDALQGSRFRTLQIALAAHKVIALSVERDDTIHTNPGPEFVLEPDDSLLALADDERALDEALASLSEANPDAGEAGGEE